MSRQIFRAAVLAISIVSVAGLAACSPKVGSKEWCDNLKKKPKGDWTANEVADFAKHCVM